MSRDKQSTALPLKILSFILLFIAAPAVGDTVKFSESDVALLSAFGPWPSPMPADPGNEYSGQAWAESLGAQLFNDPALSGNGLVSCATCHQSNLGFSESTAVSIAGAKAHTRNTQGLLNVGYQRWFGWDGGADSLWSASLRPMLSDIEMASEVNDLALRLRQTPYLNQALKQNQLTSDEWNDETLVVSVGKFLGAYMRTLVSEETAFDRFLTALKTDPNTSAPYSLSAQRGMKVFFGEGNCFVCHFGPNFSNSEFHDIGRPFFTGVGQVDPGRFSGIERLKKDPYNLDGYYNGTKDKADILKTTTVKSGQVTFGQWRTPSLRNLTLTAPYMHDGSLATLRDVVDYYADIDPTRLHSKGEALLKPFDWTDATRNDLVEFLETLSPAN